jgi:hypothetical protein
MTFILEIIFSAARVGQQEIFINGFVSRNIIKDGKVR